VLYPGPMPKLTRIDVVGNNLSCVIDDGRRVFAFPTPSNLFILRDPIEVEEQAPSWDPIDQGNGAIVVGDIPDSLSAKAVNGTSYNLNKTQLTHAANIIITAAKIEGIDRPAVLIALITAIVESVLYMYANSGTYPESAQYPHDRDGQDHDSLGLFQQRPQSGWGRVEELMNVEYSTRAFIGGSTGPNKGNPPGLFDKTTWRTKSPGEAAQSVQVSAHPERYDNVVPVAQAIMDALIISAPGGGDTGPSDGGDGSWMWPLSYSKYVIKTGLLGQQAQFGMRTNPVTGAYKLHAGLDFGGAGVGGLPVPAACAGTVKVNAKDARGNNVTIDHGNGWKTNYFHMRDGSISVTTGQQVNKGDKLGLVGTTGSSTGQHLHWETIENGQPVNPRDFMKARGVPEA
jgi:murein DD-endopeptidase